MEEAPAGKRKRLREGDAVTSAAAAAGDPQYTYLPIADALKVPGVRVSLLAVVSEIGATLRSSGTDYTLTLRIVDQSRPAGISVTFLADDPALLPCVKSNGDVISLQKITITKFGDFLLHFTKNYLHSRYLKAKYVLSAAHIRLLGIMMAAYMTELLTQMRTCVGRQTQIWDRFSIPFALPQTMAGWGTYRDSFLQLKKAKAYSME